MFTVSSSFFLRALISMSTPEKSTLLGDIARFILLRMSIFIFYCRFNLISDTVYLGLDCFFKFCSKYLHFFIHFALHSHHFIFLWLFLHFHTHLATLRHWGFLGGHHLVFGKHLREDIVRKP